MRNTKSRRTTAMNGTAAIRLYAVDMGVSGRESVTATPQSTRSAKSVIRKDCCGQWRKYTISCHWQRAGRMTRRTSCRCASPAMQGFMRSAATGGISVRSLCAGSLWTRQGPINLYSLCAGERAWGHTHKNRKSNGGLTPRRFP